MKFLLINIICLIVVIKSFGQQNTGTVIFVLNPIEEDLFIKLDDTIYNTPKIILPEGNYDFKIWSPNHLMIETSINIISDSILYYRKVFTHTSEYKDFVKAKINYRKKVVNQKIAIASLGTLLTLGTAYSYYDAKKHWDVLLQRRNDYESNFQNTESFDVTEKGLLREIRNYDKKKNRFYILSISTAVNWGLYFIQSQKWKKVYKPQYSPENMPFSISYNLEGLNTENSNGNLAFTLRFSLN